MDSGEGLRGAVARVVDAREVILNKGASDGLEIGQYVQVLNPVGSNVIDPETKRSLGSIDIPKVVLRVVQTGEHLAIARTYRSEQLTGGIAGLSAALGTGGLERSETLVATEVLTNGSADLIVKTGDPFVVVSGQVAQKSPRNTKWN